MFFVILAILSLGILLSALILRDREAHPPAEYLASGWQHLNLSAALREVCQAVLAPKTLLFLGENAPAEIATAFGREQLRLARYSLRIASDTLVQNLARKTHRRSNFSGAAVHGLPSGAKSLFLLALCTLGRMGLGLLRSMNWGVPSPAQAWISARILLSMGTLLEGSPSLTEPGVMVSVDPEPGICRDTLMLERPSTEVSLSQQIQQVLLKALPNDLSRMIYVATMRDNNSGHYYYPELTRKFSTAVVDRAMLACHNQLFDRVVQLSLEDLTESLDVYMLSTHVLKARVIQSWKKLRAYRATIPIDSDPISAEVFFMKIEVAVAILEARLPAHP